MPVIKCLGHRAQTLVEHLASVGVGRYGPMTTQRAVAPLGESTTTEPAPCDEWASLLAMAHEMIDVFEEDERELALDDCEVDEAYSITPLLIDGRFARGTAHPVRAADVANVAITYLRVPTSISIPILSTTFEVKNA